MIRITSRKDPVILSAEALRRKPSESAFLMEGYRFVQELPAGTVKAVFTLCPEKHGEFLAAHSDVPVYHVTEPVMKKIAVAKSGQDIVCIVQKPPIPCPDRLVLLDGVQDPGNVGTILRTAYAFGFGAVVSPHSADPFSQKVIAGTAGSFLRCYVRRQEPTEAILQEKARGAVILGTAIDKTALPPEEVAPTSPLVLVIGSEGQGISPQVRALCDRVVYIPMLRPFNSLNAASAAAILIYALRPKEDAQ